MKKNPQELVNNNLYQVFLMSCRCGFPISFARHHWFIVNNKGKLDRWEVLIERYTSPTCWGHLTLNVKEPFEPLGLFTIKGKSIWEPDLLGFIEGSEGSLAEKMVKFIENSNSTYPFCDKYRLFSPNSNTYVQWVLNNFDEFKGKLPWNGFGKGHYITF